MARSRLRDERPKKKSQNPKKRAEPHTVLVSARPREHQKGVLRVGNFTIPCALGRNGIGLLKREGDGKTPLASMSILFGLYRRDRWPVLSRVPWLHPVNAGLGWCDAPQDVNYNRAIALPYTASHEILARIDGVYDCVIVLNWNMSPRARNRGSAVFMHIAREGYEPTEGCIAVSRRDMMRLVKVLRLGDFIKTTA